MSHVEDPHVEDESELPDDVYRISNESCFLRVPDGAGPGYADCTGFLFIGLIGRQITVNPLSFPYLTRLRALTISGCLPLDLTWLDRFQLRVLGLTFQGLEDAPEPYTLSLPTSLSRLRLSKPDGRLWLTGLSTLWACAGLVSLELVADLQPGPSDDPATFPAGLCSLLRLTNLRTSGWFARFPDDVTRLTELRRLEVLPNEEDGTSRLCSLPAGLGSLRNLHTLSIDGSPVREIPASIIELPQLALLSICACALTSFPYGLDRLVALREVRATNSNLHFLPASFFSLQRRHSTRLSIFPATFPESFPALLSALSDFYRLVATVADTDGEVHDPSLRALEEVTVCDKRFLVHRFDIASLQWCALMAIRSLGAQPRVPSAAVELMDKPPRVPPSCFRCGKRCLLGCREVFAIERVELLSTMHGVRGGTRLHRPTSVKHVPVPVRYQFCSQTCFEQHAQESVLLHLTASR